MKRFPMKRDYLPRREVQFTRRGSVMLLRGLLLRFWEARWRGVLRSGWSRSRGRLDRVLIRLFWNWGRLQRRRRRRKRRWYRRRLLLKMGLRIRLRRRCKKPGRKLVRKWKPENGIPK